MWWLAIGTSSEVSSVISMRISSGAMTNAWWELAPGKVFNPAARHLSSEACRSLMRNPMWPITLPSVPPVGSAFLRRISTSGNLMTSMSPSLTGAPPRAVQKTQWAWRSRTFMCRCPMETPAALGAGSWDQAAEVMERRKIAEVRVRIYIEPLVCHLSRFRSMACDGLGQENDDGRRPDRRVLSGKGERARLPVDAKAGDGVAALVAAIEESAGRIDGEAARIIAAGPLLSDEGQGSI